MTYEDKKEAARQFIMKWQGKGKEDEDDRSYWLDILQRILGMENATDNVEFQKKVLVEGHIKRIDVYLPDTKIIIEQKSLGKALDKKIHNSGDVDLTPYEQAKRYYDNLPLSEKGRYIVISNFAEIWIYDMEKIDPQSEIEKINIENLQTEFYRLEFLEKIEASKISKEMEVSIQAGDIVGLLYDELYKNYADPNEDTLKSLNKLCVRLVFCMYAEDAGLFGKKDMFHDYLIEVEPKKIRRALKDLFRILDTPESERDPDEDEDLLQFPYVNGGLFSDEDIAIPQFTDELKDILLQKASNDFNWSEISPTIFGAIFESTLNPETRRSGGMHYTSIENIHKVIDPLFLDELKNEFEELKKMSDAFKHRTKALQKFQEKIASLSFFDPAAGSGNFLTETYISLRKLENEIIRWIKNDLFEGQQVLDFVDANNVLNIKVSIQQFYGIEINDFAVTVAKTALWIAEAQMMQETLAIADVNEKFVPLKSYVNIVEGNSLKLNWNSIIPAEKCNYIMGNPPFVGARLMSDEQKKDLLGVFDKSWKNASNLDYVSCWYKLAADYMKGTSIKAALVSTNSITQGETAAILWENLFDDGIKINFAHRTFIWDSEASIKAHVHCVIVGFSYIDSEKTIFEDNKPNTVNNINAYLLDAPSVFIKSRKIPLSNVPQVIFGSMPNDNGYLSDYDDEKKNNIVNKYPEAEKLFRQFLGATEFLHSKHRWCIWLQNVSPSSYNKIPPIREAVEMVKKMREESKREATRKLAETPMLFGEIRQPDSEYLIIPRHSSEKRNYIPIGYETPDVICGDSNLMLPNATLFEFGVMTSNVHMAWMSAVCGRIKSDYRYSVNVVYNNFPWIIPDEKQRQMIEKTAKAILEARRLFPTDSLSDLYDPVAMPPELKKAHINNDRAVMILYGMIKNEGGKDRLMTRTECVASLMKMYQEKVSECK